MLSTEWYVYVYCTIEVNFPWLSKDLSSWQTRLDCHQSLHRICFVFQSTIVSTRSGQASGLIHGVLQGRHCSYTFTEKETEERTQSVIRQVLLITALECTNEITPENLATMKRIAPLMKLMPCCRNYCMMMWGYSADNALNMVSVQHNYK